jgi:hypothetical protein
MGKDSIQRLEDPKGYEIPKVIPESRMIKVSLT